ncbi:MAG TPA: hypothetical protein VJY33_08875 [Isosphaeraceae bacterium]|nr:hypothetical protein [Isosphaeraceae bacterium]
MGSRKIWTVVMMLFGSYTTYAPRSDADWGGFSFNPPPINISPPKIGGELGKIGANVSSAAKQTGGFVSSNAKHAGGVVSNQAKVAAGSVSGATKHAGAVAAGGFKHAGSTAAKETKKVTGSLRPSGIRPSPGMINTYPLFHHMATTVPFPHASFGNQPISVDVGGVTFSVPVRGKVFGNPYDIEVGIRNQTESDLLIDAIGYGVLPDNPLLAGTAGQLIPWANYAGGSAGSYGAKGLFKKIYGPNPPPSTPTPWDPRNPTNYILSAQGGPGTKATRPLGVPSSQVTRAWGKAFTPSNSLSPTHYRPGTVTIQPSAATSLQSQAQSGRVYNLRQQPISRTSITPMNRPVKDPKGR